MRGIASAEKPGQRLKVGEIAAFQRGVRVAHGETRVDGGDALAHKLNIGQVGQHAHLGGALQGDARGRGGVLHQPDHGGVRDDAVQRAAAVEGVKADARAAAQPHVAPVRHVGRVGGEHQVDLDGDVGHARLRGDERAAQVEFLLHGEDQMHGRPVVQAGLGKRVRQVRSAPRSRRGRRRLCRRCGSPARSSARGA